MKKIIYTVLFSLFLYSCGETTKPTHSDTVKVVVDSVWVKQPGEINTMQVDYIYFAKTQDGKEVSSRNTIRVGDTLTFIYNNYKK